MKIFDKIPRKECPVYEGFMKYFPRAVAAVANLSYVGNEQHNPGEPLHWAKEKSNKHLDSLVRHILESGSKDEDGVWNDVKIAWRAMAHLETFLENLENSSGDSV